MTSWQIVPEEEQRGSYLVVGEGEGGAGSGDWLWEHLLLEESVSCPPQALTPAKRWLCTELGPILSPSWACWPGMLQIAAPVRKPAKPVGDCAGGACFLATSLLPACRVQDVCLPHAQCWAQPWS